MSNATGVNPASWSAQSKPDNQGLEEYIMRHGAEGRTIRLYFRSSGPTTVDTSPYKVSKRDGHLDTVPGVECLIDVFGSSFKTVIQHKQTVFNLCNFFNRMPPHQAGMMQEIEVKTMWRAKK
jgi:hypothetical protein